MDTNCLVGISEQIYWLYDADGIPDKETLFVIRGSAEKNKVWIREVDEYGNLQALIQKVEKIDLIKTDWDGVKRYPVAKA